jgi:muramoyltetrapeptide carboxypeptidase LdcA involved in peptidoglycan recycling
VVDPAAMRPHFRYPPKPVRGDTVAVVSASGRAAARFPVPFDLGLRRLREELGLEPVEYPTTRAPEASPAERARDVHAAFADPAVKAVLASIGGEDELRVLSHLDPDVLTGSPKPFFGYSDNTNLHLFLWNLGLVSYHGGAVMVQLGRPGSMHPATRDSLERALFTHGTYPLTPPTEYTDEEGSWADEDSLAAEPAMFASEGWSWHGPEARVTGPGWGGSLEIVDFHLRTTRYLLPNEAYDGAVLFLETSEELPSATYVERVLLGMGERGLLARFAAVLWGRPKAWSFESPHSPEEKARYVEEQRVAVLRAMAEYNPRAPVVFGIDIGHTDPQYVVPSGGEITVDGQARRVDVTY